MNRYPHAAGMLLLALLLALLPIVAGKLWVWQTLLVGVAAAVILIVLSLAWLLPGGYASGVHAGEDKQPGRRNRGGRSPKRSDRSGQTPGEQLTAAAVARPGFHPDAIDLALAVFLALQGLSWFVSVYRFATAVYLVRLAGCAVLFWVCRYALRDLRWRRCVLWAIVAGAGVLSVIGLREYVRTVYFLNQPDWRVFSTMFNPNMLAGYFLLTIFPAAALLLGSQSRGPAMEVAPAGDKAHNKGGDELLASRSGQRRERASKRPARPAQAAVSPTPRLAEIGAAFAIVLMFVTLLLTGSKAALGALLVGAVIFALVGVIGKRARTVRWVVIAGIVATVALALVLPPIRVRLFSAFGWQSNSAIFRAYTWEATLHMVAARPWLGFGGGTFQNAFPQFAIAAFTRAAHEAFLQLAAECGLPALIAGLVWGILLLLGLRRRQRQATEVLTRLAAGAAVAAVLASATQELVDYAWYNPAVIATFFALAGTTLGGGFRRRAVATAETDAREHSPELQPSASPRAGRIRPRLALLAGLLLLLFSAKYLYAEILGLRAESQVRATDYTEASDTYLHALRWNPGQARFWVQLSQIDEARAAGGDQLALARAVQERQAAIRLQPTEPVNYMALSRLYEMQKKWPQAVAAARAAVNRYPTYPRGLAQLGLTQEEDGEHAAALATFRRLSQVYFSPVGEYPPVPEMVETAYAYAWIFLGDEARRQSDQEQANKLYGQAADLLIRALGTGGSNMNLLLAEAGEGGYGHEEENEQIARHLIDRYSDNGHAHALMKLARLHLGINEPDRSRLLLRDLVAGRARVTNVADRLAVAWAYLALAHDLQTEAETKMKQDPDVARSEQEKARGLAKKGLKLAARARAGQSAQTLAAANWSNLDGDALASQQVWARKFLLVSGA